MEIIPHQKKRTVESCLFSEGDGERDVHAREYSNGCEQSFGIEECYSSMDDGAEHNPPPTVCFTPTAQGPSLKLWC